MPYDWQPCAPDGAHSLLIWRYRSLSARGFVHVIAVAACLLCLPLLSLIGRGALWALLPFVLSALAALWWAVQHGWRGGGPREQVTITPQRMVIERHDPGHPTRRWEANPYWVRIALRRDGPVEDYLTLTDGGRVVELGAFLSPAERRALRDDLADLLDRVKARRA